MRCSELSASNRKSLRAPKKKNRTADKLFMRIDYKFRHSPQSEDLKTYVSDRLSRLEKFELKPVRVEVTFTSERTAKRVDIHVRGENLEVHAHCEAETFLEGVDVAIDKISRQMAKKKDRVQDHKAPKVG